ncbi:TPA: GIY-YIG nuclease family protein [Burkholderia cepacia]|uniref:GIY-YIG nuclease family protein n=1 Tax=Burkholderia cepacia TaxID=292 RepID=UPI001CF3ABD8|nr:GIY-YIG nuclease family protein [Burkholderia cepacia]MCA8363612.1 GIY-YIG nuclease family protein [Burkholderia cepacia]HDR9761410.1 GIY-YIG nuclease family protein [Burkholderia cepacia ATCC 25416]HDV6371490.1 GIY-YIG nuclease family protein [Burkholderia cepacia]
MSTGKSIKLFLADGSANGIITAEIMNWSGHVIAAPRSRLADLLKRREASRAGLYILIGDKPNGEEQIAYIGETESIEERLTTHAKPEEKGGKDFWRQVFLITSKDENLTKGHLRYIESKLITIASTANRITLENSKGVVTEYGMLPEADRADMLYFIEQIKLVLPVLGLDLLRETPPPVAREADGEASNSPVFILSAPKLGITARAQEIEGEFVVESGSFAKSTWTEKNWNDGYSKLHQQLQEHGVLVPTDSGLLQFAKEHSFNSPSAASAVILGRADNGRKSWRTQRGNVSYGDWQAQQLENELATRRANP